MKRLLVLSLIASGGVMMADTLTVKNIKPWAQFCYAVEGNGTEHTLGWLDAGATAAPIHATSEELGNIKVWCKNTGKEGAIAAEIPKELADEAIEDVQGLSEHQKEAAVATFNKKQIEYKNEKNSNEYITPQGSELIIEKVNNLSGSKATANYNYGRDHQGFGSIDTNNATAINDDLNSTFAGKAITQYMKESDILEFITDSTLIETTLDGKTVYMPSAVNGVSCANGLGSDGNVWIPGSCTAYASDSKEAAAELYDKLKAPVFDKTNEPLGSADYVWDASLGDAGTNVNSYDWRYKDGSWKCVTTDYYLKSSGPLAKTVCDDPACVQSTNTLCNAISPEPKYTPGQTLTNWQPTPEQKAEIDKNKSNEKTFEFDGTSAQVQYEYDSQSKSWKCQYNSGPSYWKVNSYPTPAPDDSCSKGGIAKPNYTPGSADRILEVMKQSTE